MRGLDDKKSEERKQLFEIHEQTAAYFQQMLSTDEARRPGRFWKSGKSAEAFVKRFGLGYAPAAGLMATCG